MAYKAALIFCILLVSFPTKVGGGPICYASCLAAVGGGGFIAGAAVLPLLGFTSAGITAGSWAAVWMGSYLGAVPAGSLLAFLQSIGAAGASWTSYGSGFGICSALCATSDLMKSRDEDNNTQTEPVILNGETNVLNQTNSTKEEEVVATRDSPTIRSQTLNSSSQPSYSIKQYPREKSVDSAAYQELKMSVLEMEKSKIEQEKRKLMAETETIDLQNKMLKLQIEKLERDFGDNDK